MILNTLLFYNSKLHISARQALEDILFQNVAVVDVITNAISSTHVSNLLAEEILSRFTLEYSI
jgi:hypothetical protein